MIHVVDDDLAVLRALSRLLATLGYRCTTYTSAEAFLSKLEQHGPGCAVVDLQLPGADGLELQLNLTERQDGLPLIFLTGQGDVSTSVRAMKGGAVDFLQKPVEKRALLAAIEAALSLDGERRRSRRQQEDIEQRLARLTPREREVLEMVAAGRLNKQIAGDFGIAEKTIKVHRARVMAKLGVRTVADLVRFVVARGGH